MQSAKGAAAVAGKGAKAAAPAVAKKVQAAPVKKPVKSIVNAALIRKVDPKNLVWPAHATHLFIDASPSIFQLPLTRRLHSTMKLRARAQELLMMIAFDFHHKMPALKSTTVVWDHTPEVHCMGRQGGREEMEGMTCDTMTPLPWARNRHQYLHVCRAAISSAISSCLFAWFWCHALPVGCLGWCTWH